MTFYIWNSHQIPKAHKKILGFPSYEKKTRNNNQPLSIIQFPYVLPNKMLEEPSSRKGIGYLS